MSLTRVCVYAGSSPGADSRYAKAAARVGAELARRGIGLIYGGGSVGLMGVVADAALAAGGEVIGVLPEALDRREVRHEGLTELRIVASMHERKAMMADLADAFVALPGGLGTFEELLEVATWTQLGLHSKPVGVLSVAGFYDDLARALDHAQRERFLRAEHRELVISDRNPDALIDRLAAWKPAPTDKWMDLGPRDVGLPPRGPLVGTSAIVVRDGRVLLGRRRGAHGDGEWSCPGGKVDAGEAPADAAARELLEETGLVATSVTALTWTNDVFMDHGLHYVTLHHLIEAQGAVELREPDTIAEWDWFAWDNLPQPLFEPLAALLASGWEPPGTRD